MGVFSWVPVKQGDLDPGAAIIGGGLLVWIGLWALDVTISPFQGFVNFLMKVLSFIA